MLDLRSLVPWAGRSTTPAARDADPFTALRRDMERMFEDAFGRSLLPTGTALTMPRMDVTETATDLVVTVELPGVEDKDVTVDLTGDILTIKGEKKEDHETKEEGRHLVERSYGSFVRTVRLPFTVDGDGVEATVDKGVLTVRLPKPAEARKEPKRIEIRTTAAAPAAPATAATPDEPGKAA